MGNAIGDFGHAVQTRVRPLRMLADGAFRCPSLCRQGGTNNARNGDYAQDGKINAACMMVLDYTLSIIRFFFGFPALTNSTSAAMTLYSGHIVSPSQPWPVTLFTMASGK